MASTPHAVEHILTKPRAGDYGKCADAWKAGKYAIQPFWNRAEDADVVRWAEAVASLRRGECCRRSRRFDEARDSLKEALALFPTYGAALVADAALALDSGRASDALRNAERLAWTDRTRDGVRDAVVFAAVDVERRRLAGGTNESHNHYLVLGVTRDFGTDELRKAFRAVHKSKFHGAFDTLVDLCTGSARRLGVRTPTKTTARRRLSKGSRRRTTVWAIRRSAWPTTGATTWTEASSGTARRKVCLFQKGC